MKIIDAGMKALAARRRPAIPRDIHFETLTLKYNRMHWLTIDGLLEHWKPARADIIHWKLDASPGDNRVELRIGTENVSAFTLDFPTGTFLLEQATGIDASLTVSATVVSAEDISDDDSSADTDDGNSRWFRITTTPFSDGSARLQAHRNANGKWQADRSAISFASVSIYRALLTMRLWIPSFSSARQAKLPTKQSAAGPPPNWIVPSNTGVATSVVMLESSTTRT